MPDNVLRPWLRGSEHGWLPRYEGPDVAPVFLRVRAVNGSYGSDIQGRPFTIDSAHRLRCNSNLPRIIAIEQELARRGFGRLSKRLVEKYFSKSADERLRLVDDVLSDPSVGARPWLVLFADDSDADVRLLAVTVMATSNDRALLEKAWQVAIRDRDPRIADLAPRLRDRQGGSQRR